MENISYMWNFKPDETKDIPKLAIYNNFHYIKQYTVYDPTSIQSYVEQFPGLSKLYNIIPHWDNY